MHVQQHNILLIEDSEDDEILIVQAFKKLHITNQIVVKHDGEEALLHFFDAQGQLVLDREHFPQLILLDLQLPRLSGLEVLQQLRAHHATKHLPITMFTSSNAADDIQAAYALGANSFVQKPIDMQDFHAAIHELGIYWLLHNTPPSAYGSSYG